MIQCNRCNLQYIGETKRRLKDRFNEHRRVWEQSTGFLVLCPAENRREGERAKNEIWGWGRGRKETLSDKPPPFASERSS